MSLSGPLRVLRHRVAQSHLFAFNQLQRDRWTTAQGSRVPEGSRVLDVCADSPPCRDSFARCDDRTQDFAKRNNEPLSHGG